MDSWGQSGGTGALCNLTGIRPTAGCFAVLCPSGLSLLLKGFGGGFLSWHPCGVGTAVVCAGVHQVTPVPTAPSVLVNGMLRERIRVRSCPFLGKS